MEKHGYSKNDCRCVECYDIHSEFIERFGKWPNKTHDEGQRLRRSRIENEMSWHRMMKR